MSKSEMERLLGIMERLRDPKSGCPWDIEQNFSSIAPHTIEEAYEVADAIEQGDMAALRDELGDLLLQVVFHSQMAKDEGLFVFEDVVRGICDKLIVRHPHVFGEVSAASADEVVDVWESVKTKEREAKAGNAKVSALDGVTKGLPALTRALKLQKRAAKVGFDWDEIGQVLAKVDEEMLELRQEIDLASPVERLEDELGDILFSVVNVARRLKIDPEKCLRHANEKFTRRFQRMEQVLQHEGGTMSELDLVGILDRWRAAKKETV